MMIVKRCFRIGVAAMALAAKPVHADTCVDHNVVAQRLATIYGETRQFMGLSHDATVIEVFVAADTGSWTLTMTAHDGLTCLVAAGQAFDWRQRWLPVLGHVA